MVRVPFYQSLQGDTDSPTSMMDQIFVACGFDHGMSFARQLGDVLILTWCHSCGEHVFCSPRYPLRRRRKLNRCALTSCA